MTSHTTERFRKAFQQLPVHVQRKARKAYLLWKQNPYHASLQFMRVHTIEPVYSVRVALGWRALGTKTDDTMLWFLDRHARGIRTDIVTIVKGRSSQMTEDQTDIPNVAEIWLGCFETSIPGSNHYFSRSSSETIAVESDLREVK